MFKIGDIIRPKEGARTSFGARIGKIKRAKITEVISGHSWEPQKVRIKVIEGLGPHMTDLANSHKYRYKTKDPLLPRALRSYSDWDDHHPSESQIKKFKEQGFITNANQFIKIESANSFSIETPDSIFQPLASNDLTLILALG
jgi:hypothetical protein